MSINNFIDCFRNKINKDKVIVKNIKRNVIVSIYKNRRYYIYFEMLVRNGKAIAMEKNAVFLDFSCQIPCGDNVVNNTVISEVTKFFEKKGFKVLDWRS